jgi:nitroreductase
VTDLPEGTLSVSAAIVDRRSIKRFTDREVSRDQIEALLTAVTMAPNHRMTQPWRFYVLGPEARAAYGAALGARKARRVEDPTAARAVSEKVTREHRGLPALIAVAMVQHESPEIREEDYAAVFMGLQNLSLAALDLGLGTHLKTGAVMDDLAARDAVGAASDERIVALVEVGEPADLPAPKPRTEARDLTAWRD